MKRFYFATVLLLFAFFPAKASIDTLVCDSNVVVQNYFSTCGDCINDHFFPRFIDRQPVAFKLHIFDRWGRPVFFTEDRSEGWNGKTATGKIVEQGAYYWRITYRYPDEAEKSCNGVVQFRR
jgi:gliding motility-associated-like protein